MKSFKALYRTLAVTLLLACGATSNLAKDKKKNSPLSDEESAAITNRGRMLAQYETAVNHALAAIMSLNPDQSTVDHYVGRETPGGWVVALGRFNTQHDKFLVVYEASAGATSEAFSVKRDDPPQEDDGFYYFAARALDTATENFAGRGHPYHAAILPAPSNQMYVYLFPARTPAGVYPLGADIRYLVSPDGTTIVERRPLHKAIIVESGAASEGQKPVAGFHTHVLTDVPEDTDVFCVLMRKPPRPEYVGAGGHAYQV